MILGAFEEADDFGPSPSCFRLRLAAGEFLVWLSPCCLLLELIYNVYGVYGPASIQRVSYPYDYQTCIPLTAQR
eukprot:1187700-Prorocentrum_minimum.AAC.2